MTARLVGTGAPRRQRGVALVAVLWVVAALSILVTGLVETQRQELRTMSSVHVRQRGDALGQGAIALVAQDLFAQSAPPGRLTRTSVSFGGVDIQVEILPLNGLVDLNVASVPLLQALFSIGGGLDPPQAGQLAATLVAMREAKPAGPPPRFQAIEELLTVPGVDYDLYARLAHLVTTDSRGSGRVNPLAAAQEVLLLLAGGDQALASRIAADRDANVPGMDTTRLQAAFTDASTSSRFRFRARVPSPDGSAVIVTRDIDISRVAEGTAPWRMLRRHAPLIGLSNK